MISFAHFRLRSLAVAFCFLCALGGTVYGQGLGSIVGTVTDPSGGLVPSATVKITDEGTSLTRDTTTNAQGYYVVPSLRPSNYSVTVEATGFAPVTRKSVELQADQTVTVNLAVSVQQSSQTVTVEAPVQQVDTSTATLSEVVDRRRVIELPLNGRNAASLALITAGTVLAPASADEGNSKTFPVAVTISANGSRSNQASFRLDGANNNDIYTNVNQPFPFPDAVQEFSVQTSNYSARYGGNAGGVVNIVTKSGTNEVHGDLFEFVRNRVFNARDFFASAVDPLKRNQFGGTLGGPVVIPGLYHGKDKTFFFIGYQGTRIHTQALGGNNAYVPTAANLNGDFSALLDASNPNNPLHKRVVLTDPTTGTPYTNNQLPVTQFDPAAVALARYLPVGIGNGFVQYAQPTLQDFDETTVRLDHSITDNDRLTGRYFFDRFYNAPYLDLKNYLNNQSFTTIDSHNFMLGETHTFTPTLLNDFRFSIAREVSDRGPAGNSIGVGNLGVNIYQPPGDKIIESLGVSGYFSISQTDPATFTRDQYGINDMVSWVHGSHSFSFGADVTRAWVIIRNQFHEPGQFGFTADYNGDALASFLLGKMRTFVQGNGEFKDNRLNAFGLFAQDDWHVSRRLTVNLGLRFDPFFPWKETQGRVELFSPGAYAAGTVSSRFPNAPPGLLFPGDPGVPQYGLLANYHNISPRVGFAYDLTGDGKTSLRGGFGLFYDALQNGIYNNRFVDVTPFSTQVNLTAPAGTFSNPYLGITNPFPAPYPPPASTPFPALSNQVMTYDTANGGVYQTPVSMDYNLTVERQLPGDWLLRVAYVGLQARHLLETQELSPAVYSGSLASPDNRRLYRQYKSIALASQDANSNYNSLQVTAEKRFSRNFTVLANYTWSKSIDDVPWATSPTTVGVQASGGSSYVSPIPWYLPGRHQFDRGPSEFDHTHRLVASFIWQLPKLATAPRALRYAAGNWQLSGMLTGQSGGPITVIAGKDLSGDALNADRGVYLPGNDPYGSNACGNKAPCVSYLNPLAFALPAQGTYGDMGKGVLRGPNMIDFDGALAKDIPLHGERVHLQFRAEYFNLFNRVNLLNPGLSASDTSGTGTVQHTANLSNAGFGQITADLAPRIGQLALKLVF